jgi:hypothetical protein
MVKDELKQDTNAINAGDKDLGQSSLTIVGKQQPENEAAWLKLADIQVSPEKKIYCLKEAIKINPSNLEAKAALERLQEMRPAIPPIDLASSQKAEEKRQTLKVNSLWIIGAVTILVIVVTVIISFSTKNPGIALSKTATALSQADPNSPANIALRYFEHKYTSDDLAKNAIYDALAFRVIWGFCDKTKEKCGWEIPDILVKEGPRLKTATVTIHFITTYSVPDFNLGWAYLLLEQQNNRWVILCAEAANDNNHFPFLCKNR